MVASVDKGWAWVVLTSAFVNLILLTSSFSSFSVVLVQLSRDFDTSTHSVALAGSIHVAVSFFFCIFAGALVHYFGCRKVTIAGGLISGIGIATTALSPNVYFMYFTYGVVAGAGVSLGMSGTLCIVPCYFKRYRPLAMGLIMCGMSVGSLSAAPVLQLLMDVLGWKGAFLVHGGSMIIIVIVSASFRPFKSKNEESTQSSSHTESSETKTSFIKSNETEEPEKKFKLFDVSLLKERTFIIYCVAIFFTKYGVLTFYQHIVNCAVNRGVIQQQAALLPTMLGVASLGSRLISSFIANLSKVDHLLMFFVANFLCGSTIILMFIPDDFTSISVFTAAFGIFTGCSMSVEYTIMVNLVGKDRMPHANGLFSVFVGSSNLISSPISAKLLDTSGHYHLPFAINGVSVVLGAFIVLGIFVCDKLHRHCRDEKEQEIPSV